MVVEAPDEASELGRRAGVADGREHGGEDASVRAAVAERDAVSERGDAVVVLGLEVHRLFAFAEGLKAAPLCVAPRLDVHDHPG